MENSSSGMLKSQDHLISFIQHSLEDAASSVISPNTAGPRGREYLECLRVVPHVGEDDEDSDDEASQSGNTLADEEITETAINLLLAVLEGL